MKVYSFDQLVGQDLVIDALYKGGNKGNTSDDPLSKLLPVGNQAGFRYSGPSNSPKLVVLYSSMSDVDWPDFLDQENGLFTYYGDNKKPGFELHNTSRGGNRILRDAYEKSHKNEDTRLLLPPFLVFTKGEEGRDVIFRGLAVPGASHLNQTDDLHAIWKATEGQRFQNYKAIFTILEIPVIKRGWINDIYKNNILSNDCPAAYKKWVKDRTFLPLKAEKTAKIRTKNEQIPQEDHEKKIIKVIHEHFSTAPVKFEKFATEIARMMDKKIVSIDLTRPTKDGGRDAIGKYRLGMESNAVLVDFALEAKCYAPSTGVGVKETSRLISRLRHRQFGILVTTSYVHNQAYSEIIEDKHPIIIITGVDIAKLLISKGRADISKLKEWLNDKFNINQF